jgi:nucleoside-diphosphate kinase
VAEYTLTIIKPDAVEANKVGAILSKLEDGGFKIRAMRMVHLTREDAEAFYGVHRERPFFGSLVEFMTSGPCVPVALEGENAVPRLRELMGATDPSKADEGTIRKAFASSIERNAIHGSDSPENAKIELSFFFNALDMC